MTEITLKRNAIYTLKNFGKYSRLEIANTPNYNDALKEL